MNVKRFIGRNSREAMQKVKAAFGDDAVVLSTKPAAEGGIEILAMAGESVPAIDSYVTNTPAPRAASVSLPTGARKAADAPTAAPARSAMANLASSVQDDVKQLAMSTLSFQDYVRERMLKRRQAAMTARMEPEMAQSPEEQLARRVAPAKPSQVPVRRDPPAEDLDLSQPALRLVRDQQLAQERQEMQAQRSRESAEVRELPQRRLPAGRRQAFQPHPLRRGAGDGHRQLRRLPQGQHQHLGFGRIGHQLQVEPLELPREEEVAHAGAERRTEGLREGLQRTLITGTAAIEGQPDHQLGPALGAPEGLKAVAVRAHQRRDRAETGALALGAVVRAISGGGAVRFLVHRPQGGHDSWAGQRAAANPGVLHGDVCVGSFA